jgi:hypothetical protein
MTSIQTEIFAKSAYLLNKTQYLLVFLTKLHQQRPSENKWTLNPALGLINAAPGLNKGEKLWRD